MPSRAACLGIVLVWLGFNGWLFFRDLLPRMLPGQPPPYTIDLVEETKTRRPYVEWAVEHGGERAFRARTYVNHPAHDVFELVADLTATAGPPPLHGVRLRRMSSTYRVNSAGDLLGVAVDLDGHPQAEALRLVAADFTASIGGDVENGRLTPRLTLKLPGKPFERDLATVAVPSGGAVLLPLHPVNRVQGISLGQSWLVRGIDPIASLLGALAGGAELPLLRAKVRPEFQPFSYGRRRDVECLVIDYEGDGMTVSTWVARERGLVLCQEATLDNGKWAMYRE
ncbi:MAG: hypothetical protein U0797_21380 [Gemmataceae bacterium]